MEKAACNSVTYNAVKKEEVTSDEVIYEKAACEKVTSEEVTCEEVSCDVIRDLLPLYCDDVCSDDSRELVRRHLNGCPECSRLLQEIKKECKLSHKGDEEEQAHETIVKDMAAVWRKSVRRSFIRGAIIMLCLCAGLAGGWFALTRLIMVQVPADRMEIALEQVTEEYVEISMQANDGKKVFGCSTRITDDGKCIIIVKRGMIAQENGSGENWESTLTISRMGWLESGENVPVTAIYYGTGKNSVLIWQETGADE